MTATEKRRNHSSPQGLFAHITCRIQSLHVLGKICISGCRGANLQGPLLKRNIKMAVHKPEPLFLPPPLSELPSPGIGFLSSLRAKSKDLSIGTLTPACILIMTPSDRAENTLCGFCVILVPPLQMNAHVETCFYGVPCTDPLPSQCCFLPTCLHISAEHPAVKPLSKILLLVSKGRASWRLAGGQRETPVLSPSLPDSLHDTGQFSSLLCASVSLSVKWRE